MKISIITASFNSGATIRDTMMSVLGQNYTNYEHIIVDGNSRDNTMGIVRELEPLYEGRLKYISERDRGIYDAMNKGIALASGDVVGILNSDDFYTSNDVLSRIVDVFRKEDIDAVYGDIHFVNDNDLEKCVRYYSSRRFARWQMAFGVQPAHPSFYCKRDVYDRFGTFDINFKVAADFDHLLRLIYINRIKTRYLDMDFVTMRTGGASTEGLRSHLRIIHDHYLVYCHHGLIAPLLLDPLRYPIKALNLKIIAVR